MDTRQVLLVDAFATEPLGGVPVAVLPDGQDCSRPQLRRIRSEFGTACAVTPSPEGVRCVGTANTVGAAVAGGTALIERDLLDAGTHAFGVDWRDTPIECTVDADGQVSVELPEQTSQSVAASTAEIAGALGIDPAVMDDVSADLPVAKTDLAGGTLLAPVNFLEHLSRVDPVPDRLGELSDTAGVERVCAFTFDTLHREADVHARVFDRDAPDCERPVSGLAAGGCGAHLSRHPVFDAGRESVRIECGRFCDRPGVVETTLAPAPRISGRALTALDGTVTVPPETDDDEIIEV